MRLFLLTALTMCAFAANSVLNRKAIYDAGMAPLDFSAIRLASGAVMLICLTHVFGGAALLRQRLRDRRPLFIGGAALLAYMIGFSLAYLRLGAGVGALILFGGVQITMFAGALLARDTVPVRRWVGALLALAGLTWLLWPHGAVRLPLSATFSMGLAAIGWGIYSLVGRREKDPLAATAANFTIAAPFAVVAAALVVEAGDRRLEGAGILLAMLSGAITSGIGYALWYRILPRLGPTRAAVAQLTVPVIAATGGLVLLGERPGIDFFLAATVVLGGVAVSVLPMRVRAP